MTDIVERLRDIGDGKSGLPAEAADEIERLRTDNRGYQQDIFHLRGKLNQMEQLIDTVDIMQLLAERNELREEVLQLRAQRVQWP